MGEFVPQNLANKLRRVLAKYPELLLRVLIEIGIAPLFIHNEEAVADAVEHHLVSVVGFSQSSLSLLAFGDIHGGADIFDQLAGAIQHRMAQSMNMFDRTIRENGSMFHLIITFVA